MATNNALNNKSSPFEVGAGDLTITSGNILLPTTTTTLGQIKIAGDEFIHALGTGNTFIGYQCGNLGLTTGSATYNTGIGRQTLDRVEAGNANTCIGALSAVFLINGTWNTFLGTQGGYSIGNGSFNCSLGANSLYHLNGGSYNIGIGTFSSSAGGGSAYTGTESSNIAIGHLGTVGESNVIRIGTQGSGNGQQQDTWIAGVYTMGSALGATQKVVIVDSTGKVGSATVLPPALGGKNTISESTTSNTVVKEI